VHVRVKNLFDIAGLPTRAAARIKQRRAAPKKPTNMTSRPDHAHWSAAGAVLVGALNMGEYAYDFHR